MKFDDIKSGVEKRTVTLPDGTVIPSIGQGTWRMGEDPNRRDEEVKALQLGLDLGMSVIDTAEMYGEGGAELIVREAITGRREDAFVVSKAYPFNAGLDRIREACENSLRRLGTDYLDLYMLHWRGSIPLEETVEGMERLVEEGKIKRWGVSNFDTADMEELWRIEKGEKCIINQVLYHIGSRGIDYDLIPWHDEHDLLVMAYCPLAQGGTLRRQLLTDRTMQEVAEKHDADVLQIALAWTIRSGRTLAIPKAIQEKHIIANAKAAAIELGQEDLYKLDQAFPKPKRKMPIDIV